MATAKKLPSGSYRVQASVTIDGKLYRESFTDSDKDAAELQAKRWQVEIKEKRDTNKITLHQAFYRYIESKLNTLSPGTIREYYRIADSSLPSIMSTKVSQLTREKIQIAINIEAAHLSPKSVRNIHGLLSAVLAMFRPDFVLNTRLPQKTEYEPNLPIENNIKQLLESIKGTELEKAVCLAAFGPMRRGEICALTDEDIFGDTIRVNKAYSLDINRKWVLKQPKTEAGNRYIQYPDFVIQLFEGCRGKLVDYNPNSLTNAFERALKRNGIPSFRFHDLRHYTASILHALGYPDKYIMARGGWKSNYTLNNVYKHAMREKQKELDIVALNHFEKFFE